MLEFLSSHKRKGKSDFYIFTDPADNRIYVTVAKCEICDEPHELLNLSIFKIGNSPHVLFYECSKTGFRVELATLNITKREIDS